MVKLVPLKKWKKADQAEEHKFKDWEEIFQILPQCNGKSLKGLIKQENSSVYAVNMSLWLSYGGQTGGR